MSCRESIDLARPTTSGGVGGASAGRARFSFVSNENQSGQPGNDTRLRYRLLTGPDTTAFCERVSEALDEGYVLHGSPAITFDGTVTYVAQAVVLADAE